MNNFTPRAQQVLQLARKEADRFNHNYVGTEHLLLGLIKLGQGVAVNVLQKMGLDLETDRMEVKKQVGSGPETKIVGNIPYTPRVKKVLALAGKEAKALNHSYVGTEHILLGLLREGEGVAARVLKSLEIDIERTRNEILKELDPNFTPSEAEEGEPASKKDVKTPALRAFGRDLTELAKKGDLDPVIGRHNEIERVIQVLCRRTKNNPVLIGEAGVGKTAIAEGLAQEIASGNVPELLRDRRVITLDLALMVAGTKYRGQFEERIKAVMDEIKRSKNVILFVDELHTIVGAGSAEGAMDASNIIKPALSRGELQVVGATTMNEYRKYIEKDAALERRFQTILVEPPTVEQTVEILKGLRQRYEDHHKAKFSDEALDAASRLSDRYITGRFLPDKAIDVVDEAGARARIKALTRPPNIQEMEQDIEKVKNEKEAAIKAQDFELAASLRDKEKHAREKLEATMAEWRQQRDEKEIIITEDDIMHIVAKWTGIPLSRMEQKDAEKLLRMEDELRKTVIGQEEALTAISKAMRRGRADLKDPNRPIGSFVFLGPTGVGKTLMARALAEFMFGDTDALIQLDMIRKAGGLGFAPTKDEHTYEDMKGKLLDESKRVFKPEFMNRLDDLIVFRSLTKDDMGKIVHIEVEKVKSRMKYKDVEIHLTPAATDFLIEKGYDPNFGARPLRRAVEKYLQDPLAEEILRGNIKPTETIEVTVAEGKLAFNQLAASAS